MVNNGEEVAGVRDVVTTLLDTVGVVLVAAGAGFAAGALVGPAGMVVSGGVLLAASWLADRPTVARRGDRA